ncbi:hypothetical protein CDAR_197721 [Caerostris darwini]|uniref:Uncharacterized protein n=1 Tax=Caerostris darwini TaxID=1538125 RepID=A0AAV4SC59_9ARAC|nr:hypothetical protein CDAR_197721 [Caerostris darwini]
MTPELTVTDRPEVTSQDVIPLDAGMTRNAVVTSTLLKAKSVSVSAKDHWEEDFFQYVRKSGKLPHDSLTMDASLSYIVQSPSSLLVPEN